MVYLSQEELAKTPARRVKERSASATRRSKVEWCPCCEDGIHDPRYRWLPYLSIFLSFYLSIFKPEFLSISLSRTNTFCNIYPSISIYLSLSISYPSIYIYLYLSLVIYRLFLNLSIFSATTPYAWLSLSIAYS